MADKPAWPSNSRRQFADSLDPSRIYNSLLVSEILDISRDTRQAWYRRLREISDGSVRRCGAHFLLTGQTAFETFPLPEFGTDSEESASERDDQSYRPLDLRAATRH